MPALARACHPAPSLAVTAVATGLAVSAGRTAVGVLTVAVAVLAGQLSVGWLNDLVDAPRDAEVGRAGKPVAAGEVSPATVRTAVFAAAAVAIGFSLPSGPLATVAHVAALTSAWAYDLGVKATAFSVLPYSVSFGLLPAFVTLGLPGQPLPPAWLVGAAASLGAAAHFVNVLPDLADDAATGVRGLPHRLGAGASRLLSAALVLVASVLLVLGPPGAPSAAGLMAVPAAALILGIGLFRNRRPHSRAAFRAVLLVAVIDVVLLIRSGAPTG
ncbi:UbiA family prenyltransferase [Qaidamihabitans albus]|uniref:UbiA family prenyltransferase n=1 Tax=Qaidamihabitans albus TaxID=2795733 RepID=UPI0018F1DCFE|nr:UbiA family prenyltransferase [Qaidamihabitans albus]